MQSIFNGAKDLGGTISRNKMRARVSVGGNVWRGVVAETLHWECEIKIMKTRAHYIKPKLSNQPNIMSHE